MRGRTGSGGGDRRVSSRWILILCVCSFALGMLLTDKWSLCLFSVFKLWLLFFVLRIQSGAYSIYGIDRFWTVPDSNNRILSSTRLHEQQLRLVSEDCSSKKVGLLLCFQKHAEDMDVIGEVSRTRKAIQYVKRSILGGFTGCVCFYSPIIKAYRKWGMPDRWIRRSRSCR